MTEFREGRWSWVYRVLLRSYPRRIRHRFGDDMLECFDDLSRQARQTGGTLGELSFLLRTLGEFPRSVWQARRGERGPSNATEMNNKGGQPMDSWIADVKMAFRTIRKRPGLSLLAVASLAVGVGANTTMFSAVNALLWRDLPVDAPDRLVRIYRLGTSYSALSYPDFSDLREQSSAFEGMFLHGLETFGVTHEGRSDIVYGEVVSASYFDVLRVRPALGSFFSTESDFETAPPVVVLSYALWQRSFAGSDDILGQSIRLNDHVLTVVGVAPKQFEGTKFGLAMDAWVPAKIWGHLSGWGNWTQQRGSRRLLTVARLAPRVSAASAEQSLIGISERLGNEFPETNRNVSFKVFPERNLTPEAGDLPRLIGILAVFASGLVLLVACANVASLLYARGLARRREFAVRLALGASRRRLVRQLLVESSVLAILGGTIGVVASFWTSGFIYLFLPSVPYRFALHVAPDLRVLLLSAAACIGAVFAFGLAPALRASAGRASLVMRSDTAGAGVDKRRVRMFDGVVVAMVALSFVTLLLSGLFTRSLANVRGLDPGFGTDQRLLATFNLALAGMRRDQATGFFQQLVEDVGALPGVRETSMITNMPLGDSHSTSGFFATDVSYDADDPGVHAWRVSVGQSFFSTMEIPLLYGRSFGPTDHPDNPRTVIVNEAMATQIWDRTDVVGRRLTYSLGAEGPGFEVVGVVPTGRYRSINEAATPAVYFPFAQSPSTEATLVVFSDGELEPAGLTASVRQVARQISNAVPMYSVKTIDDHLTGSLWMFRLGAGVGGGLGLLALALAVGGLYGIMAFSVNQRIRELGIRLALGAGNRQVLTLVLRKGLILVVLGLGIGVGLFLGASRFLSGMLIEVQPNDPVTIAVVATGMFVVAALATLLPAGSATRTDPVTVLRTD